MARYKLKRNHLVVVQFEYIKMQSEQQPTPDVCGKAVTINLCTNNVEAMRELYDLACEDKRSKMLYLAVKLSTVSMVKMLLQRTIDVNIYFYLYEDQVQYIRSVRNKATFSLLNAPKSGFLQAIATGGIEMVKLFLSHKSIDVNRRFEYEVEMGVV